MKCTDIFTKIICDLWSLHLSIIGIIVSIMTLLFSSIYSKVDELKNYESSDDIHIMIRKTTLVNSISSFRDVNKKLKNVLLVTFFLFIISTILSYVELTLVVKVLISIVTIISAIIIAWGVKIAIDTYKQYQKDN